MTRIPRPEKLSRAGDIRCAARDGRTGAVWMGATHGALVYQPATGAWRHVRLKDQAVEACGVGAQGVWLASRDWLMQPEPHGAGVRRFRIADATGCGARVIGVAADKGGTWLVVNGLEGPVPSLLRLPHRPPVFQRCHVRLKTRTGRALAVAGDGERAWALGSDWLVELTDDSVVKPGLQHEGGVPARVSPAGTPAASDEDRLAGYVMQLSPACWLRARPRGLVGRNATGVFVLPHGGERPGCPELPGRLDLFATDWVGVEGAMLMASPLGLFVADSRGLAAIAPGDEIVALLDGPAPLAVTRDAIHLVDPAARAAAPRVRLELPVVARELARLRVGDVAACQRAMVARVLGLVGQPQDVAHLRALLADRDPDVRAIACASVGRLKLPGAKVLLGQMMADPATGVQAAAAEALRDC